jgi:NADPH:quinone reductase-like Zn-dependent oxidoreductase
VITTVGSAEKAERARALGADHVILYREKDFVKETRAILKAAGRRGVDVALDHVGAETFAGTLRCLDWGGRLITCGATSGSAVQIDLKPVFFKSLSILGSTMGSQADLIRVLNLARSGAIKPVVDSVFGFDQVSQAFERLENRSVFGKVVVEV